MAGQTHDASQTALEVYDLSDLRSPRLSGITARLFLAALESRILGAILRKKIQSRCGFSSFRRRINPEKPRLVLPLHYPLPCCAHVPYQFDQLDSFFWGEVEHGAVQTPQRSSVKDYANAYREGRVSPVHVAEAVLHFIHLSNATTPPLNAVISTNEEQLREEARQSAERWAKKMPISVLDGIPFVVKDLIDVTQYSTTGGLGYLVRTLPPAKTNDADCVAALRKAGMIMVGKTNTDELGMGVRGHNRFLGQCRNPWDVNRVPGGSSGGSAAAVAAGLSPIALGTDGGGSIRIPAACCGVFGLKPTFARLSVNGRAQQNQAEISTQSTADSATDAAVKPPPTLSFGHFASCAADLALVYYTLSSLAPQRTIPGELAFSAPLIDPLPSVLSNDVSGLRVGIYREWVEDTSARASLHTNRTIDTLAASGAIICSLSVPLLEDIRVAHVVSIASDTYKSLAASGGLAPDKWRLLSIDVRAKMRIAAELGEDDIGKAQVVRAYAVYKIVADIFSQVDVLLTPALGMDTPRVPRNTDTGLLDAYADSSLMRFMTFANLTGLPAVTMPVAVDTETGLPYAIQAIAGPWQEATLLRLCKFVDRKISPKMVAPHVAFDVLEEAGKLKMQMNAR